jgi:hypothetical protein
MTEYRRPEIPVVTFRDESGAVIEYGRRWRERSGGSAPEDSYSVVSHPERFAPLHAAADALVAYLTGQYDAAIREDVGIAAGLYPPPGDGARAIHIDPANGDGAPLTFVFTTFPGVRLYAGVLHEFPFPDCGCDACDETAEHAVAEMEEIVFAVAEGRFRETCDDGDDVELPRLRGRWTAAPPDAASLPTRSMPMPGPKVGLEIVARDGSFLRGGQHMASGYPREQWLAARAKLRELEDGWRPWRTRR